VSFPSTRWTLVLEASDPASRGPALQELLAQYWLPVYVYLRQKGASAEDAEELVQELFIELVERDLISRADPQRGRLRGFLKACADQQWMRRREKAGAWKRGGRVRLVALDTAVAERVVATSPDSAEAACDRAWARQVMDRALSRLLEDAGDRAELLRTFFGGQVAPSYGEAAARFGMSVPQLKSALHRARVRYRGLLLEEVQDTVQDPSLAEAELAALLAAG
jgi:RNA polymerase sigma-70 factor (ECF subfamily)